MAGDNRGVVYTGPGNVEVQGLDYPKLELPDQQNRQLQHGVILKVFATNICGSDQHMVRGRTTAPVGQTLGHEITGEVVEVGRDVEFIKAGDLVSVPFNIACGRCRNCKERNTGVCENVNPARAGAAYGYVDMGGWMGGQAQYVTVPYADWNLLKFPDKDQAMEKIVDLAMLSDIFPTGYHGAVSAGVGTGSTVYVAGAGPVGLACATSAHLLGAAVVIVGDMNADRLRQAASFGCETIDLSATDDLRGALSQILGGSGEVDAAVDCVGFEARGHGQEGSQGEAPATVLNSVMDITRAAGRLGIPGLYVTGDPGAVDEPAKVGSLSIRIGLGWAKSHAFQTGQCPVMKYNRQLMMAILHDKVQIAKNVNATVIPLDEAPQGYQAFDQGAAKKYVLDPHGMTLGASFVQVARQERPRIWLPRVRKTPRPSPYIHMRAAPARSLAEPDIRGAFPTKLPSRRLLYPEARRDASQSSQREDLQLAFLWTVAMETTASRLDLQRSVPGYQFETYGFVQSPDLGTKLALIIYVSPDAPQPNNAPAFIKVDGHNFPVVIRSGRAVYHRLEMPISGSAACRTIHVSPGDSTKHRGFLTAAHAVAHDGDRESARAGDPVATIDSHGNQQLRFILEVSSIMDAALVACDAGEWTSSDTWEISRVVGYKPIQFDCRYTNVPPTNRGDIIEFSGPLRGQIQGQYGATPRAPCHVFSNIYGIQGDSGGLIIDLETNRPYAMYLGTYESNDGTLGCSLMLAQPEIIWGIKFYR